jgi:hypothetical protein
MSDAWIGVAAGLAGVAVGGGMTLVVEWVRSRRAESRLPESQLERIERRLGEVYTQVNFLEDLIDQTRVEIRRDLGQAAMDERSSDD